MEKLIESYKDNNGFIKSLLEIYKSLVKNDIAKKDAINNLSFLYSENISSLKKYKENYNLEKKILENRNKEKVFLNYEKELTKDKTKESNKKEKDDIFIDFYIDYINENIEDDAFLDILPKQLDEESIKILTKILNYYKSKINFAISLLSIEDNKDDFEELVSDLVLPNYIYEKIIEYKDNLKNIKNEEKDKFKNNILFFMNSEEPYLYYDIVDNPTCYSSINKLLNSIINGTFKNITKFTDIPGLLEVRDISNQTRIIFERVTDGYMIIGAITNKAETNKLYSERLRNRFKTYINNKSNIGSINNVYSLKKLFDGDNNE